MNSEEEGKRTPAEMVGCVLAGIIIVAFSWILVLLVVWLLVTVTKEVFSG